MTVTKILLIDNDKDFLEATSAILTKDGYTVDSAMNVPDALAMVESFSPDLIFCDMMMEDVDSGFQVASKMKEKNCDAPIYLTSSVADATNLNCDVREKGFAGTLQKPIDASKVLGLVDDVKSQG